MTEAGSSKPRLVVVSAVHPFPGHSGQQQRVRNKLLAFRGHFHATFLTVAAADEVDATRDRLLTLCDEVIVLPSLYRRSQVHRLVHRVASVLYAAATGLKRSNYIVGQLELAPYRVRSAIGGRKFDLAVLEYWHAAAAVPLVRASGARCVLDMHDILWRSYDRQLRAKGWMPSFIRDLAVARYREKEERAWRGFDAVITINRDEDRYVRDLFGEDPQIIFTPMGVDLQLWAYSWAPVQPPRVAYYGGLGSPHNQRDALFCFEQVMPIIWRTVPEAELWIVGSNPPPGILELETKDPRVRVTGFVEDIASMLASASVVLCPWSGSYGFRSRIIETMAVGVPVVASPDCVAGMEFDNGVQIELAVSAAKMAEKVVKVISSESVSLRLSRSAFQRVVYLYSFEKSYKDLAHQLVNLASDETEAPCLQFS